MSKFRPGRMLGAVHDFIKLAIEIDHELVRGTVVQRECVRDLHVCSWRSYTLNYRQKMAALKLPGGWRCVKRRTAGTVEVLRMNDFSFAFGG